MASLNSAGTVTVIGTGYVGLVTGACLAKIGHSVMCADIDQAKIDSLQRGEVPIFESGLQSIVDECVDAGRLTFTTDISRAAAAADFVFLCVPTPQSIDGAVDLSFLDAAASNIGPFLQQKAIVINKSTVPVGSTRLVERCIGRRDVSVVSNPEFLREGSAVQDFLEPDRIVIGSEDQAAAIRVASLYAPLAANVMITDPASAETIKYAANAFLATKLSFINAVAAVCEGVGADINDVVLGLGYDHRIGTDFLRPGPGWGGSCFPKDTRALVRIAEDAGYDFSLLRGVIGVNDEQFDRVVAKVRDAAGGSLQDKTVTMLGLAFKAGTDDTRDSPALEVAKRLITEGAHLQTYDPKAKTPEHLETFVDPYAACHGSSVLVVMTEWDEFRWLDFNKIGDAMESKAIVDTRNILDRSALRRLGFEYQSIGRS